MTGNFPIKLIVLNMEPHGIAGSVTQQSEPGMGVSVWLSCGFDLIAEALGPILPVEDNLELHGLVRFILEQAGCQVESDYGGEEALEILHGTTPSVVLLDIKLPGMDGFTTGRKILELCDLPIVVVAAMDQPDEVFP